MFVFMYVTYVEIMVIFLCIGHSDVAVPERSFSDQLQKHLSRKLYSPVVKVN